MKNLKYQADKITKRNSTLKYTQIKKQTKRKHNQNETLFFVNIYVQELENSSPEKFKS